MLPAGTMIPEKVDPMMDCGTEVVGWMCNGVHPTRVGEEVGRKICFTDHNNELLNYVYTLVTNCGEYFVYKLPKTPACPLRYCAEQKGNNKVFHLSNSPKI